MSNEPGKDLDLLATDVVDLLSGMAPGDGDKPNDGIVVTDPAATQTTTEPVVTEPVVTEPVVTEPVKKVEEPVVTEPVTEPVVAQPPAGNTEIDALKAQVEALQQLLTTMTAQAPSSTSKVEELPEAIEPEVVSEFVKSEEELTEIFRTREGFNKFLSGVYEKAVREALRLTPAAVNNLVNQRIGHQLLIQQFYNDNPELAVIDEKENRPQIVSFIATRVASEHTDWDVRKVFQETERQARALYRLPPRDNNKNKGGATTTTPGPDNDKPSFAGGNTGRVSVPSGLASDLKKQVAEIL